MPVGGKGGGGGTTEVHVHNDPITVDADSTVDIVGLDNVKLDAKLAVPEPIKSEATVHADSTQALSVDLKPVALDVCLTASIAKLPEAVIRQPYQQHLGFTWFGVEVFGFNVSGETKIVMEPLPKRPTVEWPVQRNAERHEDRGAGDGAAHSSPSGPGLRIRVK